jgi:hypothetical protein
MCAFLLSSYDDGPFLRRNDRYASREEDDDEGDEKCVSARADMTLIPVKDGGSQVLYTRVDLNSENSDVQKDASLLFYIFSNIKNVLHEEKDETMDLWDKKFGDRNYDERTLLDHFYATCQLTQDVRNVSSNRLKKMKPNVDIVANKLRVDDDNTHMRSDTSDLLAETIYLNDDLNVLWKDQHTLSFNALK